MADNRLCKIEGCDKGGKLRSGMCGMHHQRTVRHGDPFARPAVRRHGCLIADCDRRHVSRGYCKLHYDRLLTTGDARPETPPRAAPGSRARWIEDHRSHEGDACLIWPYSRDHNGYARITVGGVQTSASRIMCEEVNGPPPRDDWQAAHSCGNGHIGCVTPRHLRWDTCAGNHADKVAHGTTSRGSNHGASKLSADDVRTIRQEQGVTVQRDLAARFGVDQRTIGKIQRREAWAWLD